MVMEKAPVSMRMDKGLREVWRILAERENRSMTNYLESLLIVLRDSKLTLDDLSINEKR